MNSAAFKLPRDFYLRPTLTVARELLGKYLVFQKDSRRLSARLVEVEAYIGEDDPACHAAPGKTARNEIMYGPGGFAYIYLIYGMYNCLNVVTDKEGFPAAVLIRGAEPMEGIERMHRNCGETQNRLLTDGPGKLCRAFDLTRRHNGLDLTGRLLYLEDRGDKVEKIESSSRIGIRKGRDKLWRFFMADSPYVSRKNKI
jgi:DNA-3-methyladenine glycosylase